MKEKLELKAEAFNKQNITSLADSIIKIYPEFSHTEFLKMILEKLDSCELKERSTLIEDALVKLLPKPFEKAVDILLKALPTKIQENDMSAYNGFIIMPQTGFVVREGMNNFEVSMNALYEMTKRFTSEFHIRFFIESHYEKTMSILDAWSKDKNVHVRRLVSEGTRPRLPWAFHLQRFIIDPSPVLKLLEKLKDDSELYVRRSVANNLNDISKNHPKVVTDTLKSWQNGTKEMQWLTKHALRTLLKAGNVDALALLGYKKSDKLDVKVTFKDTNIIYGNYLEFDVEILSNEEKTMPIMVDFIIYYKKANGTLQPKVFKLSSKNITPNKLLILHKKHKFANFTTRTHYAGEHKLCIVINGISYKEYSLKLIM